VRLCARQPSKGTRAKAHPTSADALYLTATLADFAPRLTVDLTGARLSGIAHGADLRGAKGLTQAQLDRMIGDDRTLLPTGRDPASGRLLDLPNCWAEPPIGFERLIDRLTNAGSIDEGKAIAVERPDGSRVAVSASDLRDLFLCPETDPVRTGTRCPPELPRERCLAIAAESEDAGWN
jgi:hypothetical protein